MFRLNFTARLRDSRDVAMLSGQRPKLATRPTGRVDGNDSAMAGFPVVQD